MSTRTNTTLNFRPLPPEVDRLSLEISSTYLPGEWLFDISLRSKIPEGIGSSAQTNDLKGVSDSQHGVTLQALTAAYHPTQTALRLHVQWPYPNWKFTRLPFLGADEVELRDSAGNIYAWRSDPSGDRFAEAEVLPVETSEEQFESLPAVHAVEQILAFEPVPPEATQFSLRVDGLKFEVPLDGLGFELDLGKTPQIGDRWPLDIWLNVADFPVHIVSAGWIEGAPGSWGAGLELEVEPVPEVEGYTLEGFSLISGDEFAVYLLDSRDAGWFSIVFGVEEGEPLPGGKIQLRLENAVVRVDGPWQLSWNKPAD